MLNLVSPYITAAVTASSNRTQPSPLHLNEGSSSVSLSIGYLGDRCTYDTARTMCKGKEPRKKGKEATRVAMIGVIAL
jgi:hypothetical protein